MLCTVSGWCKQGRYFYAESEQWEQCGAIIRDLCALLILQTPLDWKFLSPISGKHLSCLTETEMDSLTCESWRRWPASAQWCSSWLCWCRWRACWAPCSPRRSSTSSWGRQTWWGSRRRRSCTHQYYHVSSFQDGNGKLDYDEFVKMLLSTEDK